MWQLADGRLPKHDGTFPLSKRAGARNPDESEESDGEMTAQLIWHHDVSDTYLGTKHCDVASCAVSNAYLRTIVASSCLLSVSAQTLELASWRSLSHDDDMWGSWNLGKMSVSGNTVRDQSWWERYGVPMCTPNMQLQEIAERRRDGVWKLL